MLTELRKFIRLLRASYQNKEVDVFFLLVFLLYILFYGFFKNEFHRIFLVNGFIYVARQIIALFSNKQNLRPKLQIFAKKFFLRIFSK